LLGSLNKKLAGEYFWYLFPGIFIVRSSWDTSRQIPPDPAYPAYPARSRHHTVEFYLATPPGTWGLPNRIIESSSLRNIKAVWV
jgi:hypothetical protein